MNLKHKHQDTYDDTTYRISSSHSYRLEKQAAQVHNSPSLFIAVNVNTKKTSE